MLLTLNLIKLDFEFRKVFRIAFVKMILSNKAMTIKHRPGGLTVASGRVDVKKGLRNRFELRGQYFMNFPKLGQNVSNFS